MNIFILYQFEVITINNLTFIKSDLVKNAKTEHTYLFCVYKPRLCVQTIEQSINIFNNERLVSHKVRQADRKLCSTSILQKQVK